MSSDKFWTDLEAALTWPANAVKLQNWLGGAAGIAAMYYVAGGFPGSVPCEAAVKGYLAGAGGYYLATYLGTRGQYQGAGRAT